MTVGLDQAKLGAVFLASPLGFAKIQWNLGYTSESGLKNLDVELRGTHK